MTDDSQQQDDSPMTLDPPPMESSESLTSQQQPLTTRPGGAPIPPPSSSSKTGGSLFPVSRIKTIMRQDDEVAVISGDAVFAMAVAAEAFLESLAKESFTFTKMDGRKTVTYKDVAKAVEAVVAFEFLEGTAFLSE